jgi:glutamine synthetase
MTPDDFPKNAKDFFAYARQHQAEMVDLKFVDMLGSWQHCSFPVDILDEGTFEEGLGFDGSSIRGWMGIHESDMMAVPDPTTARLDPFFAKPTVSVIANVVDPLTRKAFTRDPRHIARKAEEYLTQSGVADTCFIGPEPEFFIFDEVRYEQTQHRGYYEIDSIEGAWNTARIEEPNLGYKPSFKGGYFPVSPTDTYHDLRGEMVYEMRKIGIIVEAHHHEVATAGQSEIDMKFQPLVKMGDQFMWYKYICKNVAKRQGKTVTFMPKPIFEDNGSGMHTHTSLWRGGTPLFAGDGYAGLSQLGLWAAGGLLEHAPAILAFAAPTTNSYRRLVPGFEAPVNLALSARNRSAAIRIPMYSKSPKAKRLEFRCPDPSCNGYLAWSAMLMAMLDGIQRKVEPGTPLDRDIYEMTGSEMKEMGIRTTPGSLEQAIDALETDHAFLLRGDVFTEDLIQTWMDWKRSKELDPIRLRPHPHEFSLYYDN